MRPLMALIVIVTLAGCNARPKSVPAITRVGLLTTGAPAEPGWSGAAMRGLATLYDSLLIDTAHEIAVDDSTAIAALQRFGGQGYPLVFVDGPGYQPVADKVAAEYPATNFVVLNGSASFSHTHVVELRIWEASFLLGRLAAALTRTDTIGFVGDGGDPTAALSEVGWTNGAGHGVVSRLAWQTTPMSAQAVGDSTRAVIRDGADQLFHGIEPAALEVFSVAREHGGVMVYGAGRDQSSVAPDQVPATATIDVPEAMLTVTRKLQQEGLLPRKLSYGLASGIVAVSFNDRLRGDPLSTVLLQRLAPSRDSIIKGTLRVLTNGAQE